MPRNFLTTNGLMKHLRDSGISISGSRQKRQLINDGYYHGYKGYRYNHNPAHRIQYTNYDQVSALVEFDRNLKATFYPQLMFIETALKNITLEVILHEGKSNKFNDIYDKLIISGTNTQTNNRNTRDDYHKKLELRNKIHTALSNAFKSNNPMVMHFYIRDDYVPIWAIFEILCLGEFGHFVESLRPQTRKMISESLGLYQPCDSDIKLVSRMIFMITGLRNAVAHNGIVFDTRFNKSSTNLSLVRCLEIETGITKIDFASIVDYAILITYILKILHVSKNGVAKIHLTDGK